MKKTVFYGTLKKLRLVSNNICYGLPPKPEDEVEQRLTINQEGKVYFRGYKYGLGYGKHEVIKRKNFKINKKDTDKLFLAIIDYFNNDYMGFYATDIGEWFLELTNTDGETYKFTGSLYADFTYKSVDLSNLLRETLGIEDLFAFDGNRKQEEINRITLNYYRGTKETYSEQLVIDREKGILEYIQNIDSKNKISCKYEMKEMIELLLEEFDPDDLFQDFTENQEDVMELWEENRDYRIRVDYKYGESYTVTGSYDKDGLPEDFSDFAEILREFFDTNKLGEMFSPFIYNARRRKKSDYIFCSVVFDDGYKTYYYLTDDNSIKVGDWVLVPAGKDNNEKEVKVVNIEHFSKENVPLPIDKIKNIIKKV